MTPKFKPDDLLWRDDYGDYFRVKVIEIKNDEYVLQSYRNGRRESIIEESISHIENVEKWTILSKLHKVLK